MVDIIATLFISQGIDAHSNDQYLNIFKYLKYSPLFYAVIYYYMLKYTVDMSTNYADLQKFIVQFA